MNIASKQGASANAKELQLQYNVQVDVVTQLEERVKQQLNTSPSGAPQIVKLKRDFERVQMRVKTLKVDAERLEKQSISAGGGGGGGSSAYTGAQSTQAGGQQDAAQSQQQMQLQMQQDVSLNFNSNAIHRVT